MTDKIRWGVLGNATVARRCVIPAIQKSRNGLMHALATRRPANADLLRGFTIVMRRYWKIPPSMPSIFRYPTISICLGR